MLDTEPETSRVDDESVGIREFKSQLSRFLRRVEAGQILTITDRGRPIARLYPVGRSLGERMQTLIEAGLAKWDGQGLEAIDPLGTVEGPKTLAEILLEDRR